MISCLTAGCLAEASDYAMQDGEVIWAACAEHRAIARPLAEYRGHKLTISERLIVERIEAALNVGLRLRGLPGGVLVAELALATTKTLFSSPTRAIVREHLDETEAQRVFL